jgi:DNA-binding NarL/FixJ family response regulator
MVLDGQWHEADRILEDTPCPGNAYFWRDVRLATALLARYRGNLDAAWREIRPLFPDGPETEPGDITILEGLELQRLAADLCFDAGDIVGARRWLAAHDDWLEWSGAALGVASGELGWARLCLAEGNSVIAAERTARALQLATELDQPLVRLHANRHLGEISLGADQFQKAESFLHEALALATACQAPYERALALLPLADCYLRTGRREDAAALVEEAIACFATLEAFPALERANELTARLGRTAPSPLPSSVLTDRELEVLQLVVTGQTNQSIADQLFISRETARTHVSNIFRKLDVGSRAEAVDAAHRRNLIRLEDS